MSRRIRLVLVALLVAANALIVFSGPTSAQPAPKPVDLPCATNVSAQMLGAGAPPDIDGRTLVLVRIVFGPGGSIGAHTHPGTLVLTVESGRFGFTPIGDGEMVVNRVATADAESVAEAMVLNEETVVYPGDWFVETGMVHTGVNRSSEPTTVLLTGLIATGEPLTSCVDPDAPR